MAKKYHKEIADNIKLALDDEVKMQDLAEELRGRGYSKSTDTIERFRFSLWNYRAFLENTGGGFGLPTDWRESTWS